MPLKSSCTWAPNLGKPWLPPLPLSSSLQWLPCHKLVDELKLPHRYLSSHDLHLEESISFPSFGMPKVFYSVRPLLDFPTEHTEEFKLFLLQKIHHTVKERSCNCTKPEALVQSASALRIDLQSPEVELRVDTSMLKSIIIGVTFRAEIIGA
ncbi:hypothetical protein SLEP1_g13310 [Rubroshorea leprosula]|uniref:Uncharacterized protein n=1 Tax=Rubroshorea leprosula TaxID=152421 RepID=A0AAV5IPU5_9ROSI|nr:hypothetical protein SLEP1_g13310 [Rubroshorea leprosula]